MGEVLKSALVVGADGMIGSALLAELKARGDLTTIGTSRHADAGFHFDLEHPVELPLADVAFFCAGIKGFERCAADPELARRVNVVATVEAAADLAGRGARVILLSSCAAETAKGTIYGGLKYIAEEQFRRLGDRAAWLRFSRVVDGDTVPAFIDGPYSAVTVSDVVSALTAIATSFWRPGRWRLLAPGNLEGPP